MANEYTPPIGYQDWMSTSQSNAPDEGLMEFLYNTLLTRSGFGEAKEGSWAPAQYGQHKEGDYAQEMLPYNLWHNEGFDPKQFLPEMSTYSDYEDEYNPNWWGKFLGGKDTPESSADYETDAKRLEDMSNMMRLLKSEMLGPEQMQKNIGKIQTTGQKGQRNLLAAYNPVERQSRYGVLQGRESVGTGEAREQSFETDYYGIQKKIGQGISGEREQFASDYYGKINDLLDDYNNPNLS